MLPMSKVIFVALIAFLIGVVAGISMYGAVRVLAMQGVLICFVIVVIFLVASHCCPVYFSGYS